jgi:hypothetical protein
MWTYFFIPKIALSVRSAFSPTPLELHDADVNGDNDPYVDSLYVRNLRTIKLLCDNLHAKMIFIPQVLNVDSLSRSTATYAWTPHIQNNNMPAMMNKFNQLMENGIARDNNTVIVDSIQHKYPWTSRHFADYGHFTRQGGELFTSIILNAMQGLDGHENLANEKID